MAVTDLSDGLPYWARQGAGYGGGPGPTGGPAAAPQGGPGSAAWLQYLMQMFGQGGNPANMASPDASNMSFDNPYAAAASVGDGFHPPPAPPAPAAAPTPGPAPGSILPQARGVAVPPGPMAVGNGILPQARGVAVQPGPMEPGSTTMAAPAPAAPAPVPGPLATGGATGQGASANPRFVQLDQGQNMDPTGRNRGPQMTALNLAGLFGGGQPAAPGRTPMPPARPKVAGPLADPIQTDPTALASEVSKPNWWQKFGRPDMTPDQLASAVRKPNWYRNV
jgi:hypothetical protein